MAVINLILATPCAHDMVEACYVASIFELARMLTKSGIGSDVLIMGASDLEVVRSMIASRVLAQPNYTHLLFMDSDMSFPPSVVMRMLAFDKEFVSTIYPKRQLDLTKVIRNSRDHQNEEIDSVISRSLDYVGFVKTESSPSDKKKLDIKIESGFAHSERTGMGLCLLKRQVLEEMVARGVVSNGSGRPHERSPWPVPYYGFFHRERMSEIEIFGEDYSFCRRWTLGCGGTIWACLDEEISHHGNFRYRGRYVEKLRADDFSGRDRMAVG